MKYRKLYRLCLCKSHDQARPSLRKMYYCPLVARAYYRNILTVELYGQSSSSGFVLTLDRGTPSLNRSHRCLQCLANLDHNGPNCLVRSSIHPLFRRHHSITLIIQRLSGSRAMWPAHLCFASLIALMMSLTPVSCRIQVFCFRSRRVMPSIMRSIQSVRQKNSPFVLSGAAWNRWAMLTFLLFTRANKRRLGWRLAENYRGDRYHTSIFDIPRFRDTCYQWHSVERSLDTR